jgi:hypothetical protein
VTTPTLHGYPDWGRQSASADISIFEINVTVQNALTVGRGTFFVGNMPYVWMRQVVVAGGMRTTLVFVDAETGGDRLSTHDIDTLAGMACSGPIAVTAPFMQVFTTVDVVGQTITLRLWQNASWGADYPATIHNGMIAIDGLNVNPAENEVVEAPAVHWGWGYFNAHLEGATAGRIRLLAIDYLGNTQLLAYWPNGIAPIATMLLLPPRPVRIEALNSDAVARVLYAALYFHPGPF